MVFHKFVEIGRVVLLTEGKYKNRICAIVNVIDQNRVLVDGPESKVPRQMVNIKTIHLTKFVIKVPHSCSEKIVKKGWAAAEITSKWQESSWFKRIQMRKRKARLTDFDRFRLMKARQARSGIIRDALMKHKRQVAKETALAGKKKRVPKKRRRATKKVQGILSSKAFNERVAKRAISK